MSLFKRLPQKNWFIPTLGLVLGLLFWLIDTLVDFLWFNDEDHSILNILFDPESMDLWMRSLVFVILLGFSFVSRKFLLDEVHLRAELESYKNSLEQKVEERTLELQHRNGELQSEIALRKKSEDELHKLATTDPLTNLNNRRMFQQILAGEIERENRYHNGLGIIFCDLDHFKLVNDRFGHEVGDKVLKVFAENTKKLLRDTDVMARWGGEEFIILIPQTNAEKIFLVANKIRMSTEKIDCPPVGSFTGSFGVALFEKGDTMESCIKRADDAVYMAKNNGRNRVEISMNQI